MDFIFDFFLYLYGYLLCMSSSDVIENCVMVDFVLYFKWINLVVLIFWSDFGFNGLVMFKDIVFYKGWIFLVVESF